MNSFPINEAHIVALFVESLVYGMHIITVAYSLTILLLDAGQWKHWREIRWVTLTISVVLFANATFDIVLGLVHNLKAFVFYMGQGGAIEEFSNISDWMNILTTSSVIIQTIIGDAMLVFRCWVVYEKSWRIVALPVIIWLASLASTIWALYLEATLHSKALVSSYRFLPAATTFWGLTIALNILTTSLLVHQLRKVDNFSRQSHVHSQTSVSYGKLQNLMRIIVESGLLYTTAAFVTFIGFVTGSNGVYVATAAEIQIVGISFDLIVIRTSALARRSDHFTTDVKGAGSRILPLQFISTEASENDLERPVDILSEGPFIRKSATV